MSAAESARPGPDHGPLAAVIPLIDTDRRPRRPHSSERTTVPPQPDGTLTPEQRLAASIEHLFAQHSLSLTDEATAQTYTLTIGAVRTLLEGARVKGLADEQIYQDLDGMLEGMLNAAELLG